MKAIREYATAHDIKIVSVYRGEGVSGKRESVDRLAWSGLMTALHANGVSVVIIEKLDRLARDRMVQETIIADLRKHGFEGSAWPSGSIREIPTPGFGSGRKRVDVRAGSPTGITKAKAER